MGIEKMESPVAGSGTDLRRPERSIGRITAAGFAALIGLLATLSGVSTAQAATINTYTFTQDGYASKCCGDPAIVQGTFTGLVEADGLMNLAGLTDFHLTLSLALGHSTVLTYYSSGLPSLFSFDTLSSPNASGGNSTLGFVATILLPEPSNLCIGSPTPFFCVASGNGGVSSDVINYMTTMSLPHLTLVSGTAVTPIPAPILLFGTALAGLGLLGAKARRRQKTA
jgi:hypothetical protein